MSEEEDDTGDNSKIVVKEDGSPHAVIRGLWFLAIGWELTALWLTIAWLLNITIIGLPLGIKMINLAPKVLTLKSKEVTKSVSSDGSEISKTGPDQIETWKRAVYFVLVGWWLSLIWMIVGYLLCVTVVGLPLGIVMLDRLPKATTLYRQK